MERRIPPAKREFLPGVTLTVSVMGGYSIEREGDYIGWIHASVDNRWNAYVRRPGTGGHPLGRYDQEEAVKAVVAAWEAGTVLPKRMPVVTEKRERPPAVLVRDKEDRMYQVIVSPQEDLFIAVRAGRQEAMQLPSANYAELADISDGGGVVPAWFGIAARQAWQVELTGQPINEVLVVRPPSVSPVTYSRASWEINKGCNFSCEHCYLEQRPFAGLPLPEKLRLLDMLRDMGVIWFEITGGEPLIDQDFVPAYEHAHAAGMMMEILTNGSRLHREELLDAFHRHPPHKITVSVYGASPETADALTQTRGAFKSAYRGLQAAADAGLPLGVALIVTKHNVEELDEMRALVRDLGLPFKEYASISPTYTGKGSTLESQVPSLIGKSDVFQGCPAGHTSFHVDPLGFTTMCKVGRDSPINLITEGPEGLLRLPAIADAQMLRTGGCSGCKLSSTCRVCRPMARVYQEAKAPLSHYCQHGDKERS
ncbi:radical SAM protein [Micromonospora sp. NPDC049230]|uniref:radical SAM protein n=1 Tax=Micromonospora sp. NPDC049230 TaxID=3155502 RepID=UPI0033F4BD1D